MLKIVKCIYGQKRTSSNAVYYIMDWLISVCFDTLISIVFANSVVQDQHAHLRIRTHACAE